MVSFEFLAIILTGLGLTASIIYYASVLRNSNKTQQLALETRRLQIIMDLDKEMKSFETYNRIIELLKMQWNDYDDFERKYGSDNNPENFAKRYSVLYSLNSLGILLKDGYIDADTAYDLLGEVSTIWLWVKFESVIMEIRQKYNVPTALQYFEFLNDELMKVRESRGINIPVPETFTEYIPNR
jgi:hypothetical protein